MTEITYTLTRGDDEFDLTIEYSVARYYPAQTYGPPEHCSPAEGGEIEEFEATLDGEPFALTAEEQAAIEAHIYDTHDYDTHDYSEPWED